MLPLVIQIDKTAQRRALTRAFHESPVRIGRSPFANLRLREPFVSEWHAVVRFHGQRTTYLDLGSKNPTHINGQPVTRNVEVEIDEHSVVTIGTLRLHFKRMACDSVNPEPVSEDETAFAANHFIEPEHPTGTVMLAAEPVATRARPAPAMPANGRTMMAGGAAKPPPLPLPRSLPQSRSTDAPDPLAFAHGSYRAACAQLLDLVKRDLEAQPHASRAARVQGLRRRFPELVHEPAFRGWAKELGVEPLQLGHFDAAHWLGRLCGAPRALTAEQAAVSMERVGQLLELFASAFIESRRAHQRARRKLALDNGAQGNSTLHVSDDPHALLNYLLSNDAAARERNLELRKNLADFAMHQIALLSAVVEGARSMLGLLEPTALERCDEPVDNAVLDSAPALAAAWPFAARKLWKKFVVRHHDLTQADHFTHELFGREFARRYHTIASSLLAGSGPDKKVAS